MPTIINYIEQSLKKSFDQPILRNQYAWWLLEHLTGTTKNNLLCNEILLTQAQKNLLNKWLYEITILHKPIAYILQSIPFGPLLLAIEPPILIPRPETEEWALGLIDNLIKAKATDITILDLCTGSGCIALLCGTLLPKATIYGFDIFKPAINLAQKNKESLKLNNVTFIQSDLFKACKDTTFDLIVSNPPYISPQEYQRLEPSVSHWEDKGALVAQDKGFAIIKKIIEQAPDYLKNNINLQKHNLSQLYIEIGWQQANVVKKIMQERGYTDIVTQKDSAHKDRVISGRIANVATTNHT